VGIYSIKPWFVRVLKPLEDTMVRRGVSPDALTAGAVGVSLLAGGAVALGARIEQPSIWLAAPPLLLLRLALNALDGAVARRTGDARPFGAVVNEVGDRVCDAVTLGATAFVVGAGPALAATALAYLGSLTGVLAQALTGHRDSGGPMGKADRVAVLATTVGMAALTASPRPIEVGVWAIAVGSAATAAMRLARLRRSLANGPAAVSGETA
jgi:CDP-diacylglycerol--glycerol-3-phosphate 3-phosphatidyltransferase